MIKTKIFEYYAFGFDYGLLKADGLEGLEKKTAKRNAKNFFDSIDLLDLKVTQNACKKLLEITKELDKLNESDVVSPDLAQKIKNEVNRIDLVLDSELQLKVAYQLTDKKYSLIKLLDDQEKLLGKDVYSQLEDIARKDFDLACTQIALNQPTAAAFHLMRSLEHQIKVLYYAFKKTGRLAKPMWGPMISQLRSKRNPKPTTKLLDYLDSIRVHYRNPTQHPELFYTIDEAQDLLNQTISALNMIQAEL